MDDRACEKKASLNNLVSAANRESLHLAAGNIENLTP